MLETVEIIETLQKLSSAYEDLEQQLVSKTDKENYEKLQIAIHDLYHGDEDGDEPCRW